MKQEWRDVWISEGMGEIYKDNDMLMPFVTGDPLKQPDISSWFRNMPCGCTVFYKGYCLHTSNRCEKHCDNPKGPRCWHPHGDEIEFHSKDMGQSVQVWITRNGKEWGK